MLLERHKPSFHILKPSKYESRNHITFLYYQSTILLNQCIYKFPIRPGPLGKLQIIFFEFLDKKRRTNNLSLLSATIYGCVLPHSLLSFSFLPRF